MTAGIWLLSGALAAAGMVTLAIPVALEDDGKAEFSENGCNRCHSVDTHEIEATVTSERMRGPDLSQIGDTDRLIVGATKH